MLSTLPWEGLGYEVLDAVLKDSVRLLREMKARKQPAESLRCRQRSSYFRRRSLESRFVDFVRRAAPSRFPAAGPSSATTAQMGS